MRSAASIVRRIGECASDKRSHCTRKGQARAAARALMCAPDFFGADLRHRPWMENQIGHTALRRAQAQWDNLRASSPPRRCRLRRADAGPAGHGFHGQCGACDRRHGGRLALRRQRGSLRSLVPGLVRATRLAIARWPEDVPFEGAGDALLDHARRMRLVRLWLALQRRRAERCWKICQRRPIALRLVDPRFYHLDTCFCPLSGGWLMYYPAAFDAASLEAIRADRAAEKRIEVGEKTRSLSPATPSRSPVTFS